MGYCPRCGREIDNLVYSKSCNKWGLATYKKEIGKLKEDIAPRPKRASPCLFRCPKCASELTFSVERAEEILKSSELETKVARAEMR